MHITRVELENVKSHAHAEFKFERGTTAITGANGAGKTTIIEAVAWAVFDLLDYKKDDFLRRGAKTKGSVRVTFRSGLDEREYTIYRDTATGYYVYDPLLKSKIADKKEEVSRFIQQHLGVEPGTDLEALFRSAIGVPQGTFTQDFLKTPAERKPKFDKLLKVEEYRQSAERLRETARYVEDKIVAAQIKIGRAEGELARYEAIKTEHETHAAQAKELAETAKSLTATAAEQKSAVARLDAEEKRLNELRAAREKLQSQTATAELVRNQRETETNQARAAQDKIAAVEADHKTHTSALAALKNLETERAERDRLRSALTKIETEIAAAKAEIKGCGDNLAKSLEAREKAAALTPQVERQNELEKSLETVRQDLANARAAAAQISSYEGKLGRLRENLKEINGKIKDAEEKSAGARGLEDLQRRDSEIVRDLARLRAALERDEQFEREVINELVKNHFCPLVSQKCLNLETGKARETDVRTRNGAGKTQIAVLENEQKTVSADLSRAREAEKFSAVLPTLLEQKAKITEDGTRLRREQDEIQSRAANLAQAESEFARAENELKSLGNPKARVLAFQTEAAREAPLREKLSAGEQRLLRLDAERIGLGDQMTRFAALDAEWKRLTDERDRTAGAHREFLANENLAKSLPARQGDLETAEREVARLKTELEAAQKNFDEAAKDYDQVKHFAEKSALSETEKRLAETGAALEFASRRAEELKTEIGRLKGIRAAMKEEFKEKERLEKISEATRFIRDTLKEAAPRVARNYVFHVSNEANQLFREITGNAERVLKWTEDYGILLEEDGYERPFSNLSGGEQMAAALSVRLALLKQLSDVRLAFFDEPTVNMDAERRVRLAEQISEVKHFDQLFVISHDDTFEGYVDHVVTVGGNSYAEAAAE